MDPAAAAANSSLDSEAANMTGSGTAPHLSADTVSAMDGMMVNRLMIQ